MQKPHFLNFSRLEYRQLLKDWGMQSFRADQIAHWIYKAGVRDPEQMSNLGKDMRQKLFTELDWHMPEIISKLDSVDGSTKLLLKSHKGHTIESVILRYENRTSLCVSSQVGCKLACDFCQTGKLGFVRHLERGEILSQLYLANEILKPEGLRVTHVVFMGMGEPLDNYDNTVSAANVMMAEDGFFLSARHVTLSTSGLAPEIERLAVDTRASLALSLHASRDDLRTALMPINRRYKLERLKEALLFYQKTTGRKITIEYILIKDSNCGLREAKELVKFLHGLRSKVNLIPFNAHPGLPYDRPSDEDIRSFQKHLADRSIPAPVRYSKGLDVSGACGQLAAKHAESIHAIPERKRLVIKDDTVIEVSS
jgi:23S rRNA (adenine2503-C2)-methyltransferase